jgi:hypothetical protein
MGQRRDGMPSLGCIEVCRMSKFDAAHDDASYLERLNGFLGFLGRLCRFYVHV